MAGKTQKPPVRPGGGQTRVKLSILGDYLKLFCRASQRAPHRYYIDGLAGSGEGLDPRTGQIYPGSARLSLDVDPPFTRCFLIEANTGRAERLRAIEAAHSNVSVRCADVNIAVPEVLTTLNRRAPTFAFLDPEGSELHWTTIEALARHKQGQRFKIELLLLFPLQMCVNRLLDFRGGQVPAANAARLDAMLGSESPWREILRRRLLGEIEGPEQTKLAFLDAYCDQLHRGLGYEYVLSRQVVSDKGVPLYYLVFASDNDAGQRIMRYEFGASHTEQASLFNVAEYTPGMMYDPDRERPYRL